MSLDSTAAIPLEETYLWGYDEAKDKIWREKRKPGQNEVLKKYFEIGEPLVKPCKPKLYMPSAPFALMPVEKGRVKAIKIYKEACTWLSDKEYKIAMMWPNGATGLQLHPKCYIKFLHQTDSERRNFMGIVMHKYDGSIGDIVETMTPEERLDASCQLISGLATLQSLGIDHGELHINNVLWDRKKKRYDIIDFGASVVGDISDQGKWEETRKLKYIIYGIIRGEFLLSYPKGSFEEVCMRNGFSKATCEAINRALAKHNTWNFEEPPEKNCIGLSELKEAFDQIKQDYHALQASQERDSKRRKISEE